MGFKEDKTVTFRADAARAFPLNAADWSMPPRMARNVRVVHPEWISHAMNRVDRREPIFGDGRDREQFFATLDEDHEEQRTLGSSNQPGGAGRDSDRFPLEASNRIHRITLLKVTTHLSARPLRRSDLDPDPFAQFDRWYAELLATNPPEPAAMTLATADSNGMPAARTVLLKGYGPDGFTFFTNYESQKSRELTENPRAALLFFWPGPQRQIRLTGKVERTSAQESDLYFASRPLGRRLGAWASPQSRMIRNREELETRLREIEVRYADGAVPRPPHWGGFRLIPSTFEFWQAGDDRLHDRFHYRWDANTGWSLERLGP
jgi:pyridoxamine 5'-phosphate oxidase